MGISMKSQKLSLELPYDIWFSYIITGYVCKGTEVSMPQRISAALFIMAPFIVTKGWNSLDIS